MKDEAALLRRYIDEGSHAAFAELVRRHIDLVYNAALRRTAGDSHLAADVVQEVFVSLARNARKLAQHTVLSAWLHTATRNAALNFVISEQRRKAREQAVCALEPTGSSSAEEPDWDRLRPLLDAAIDELPESDRATVVLRFLERRPFAQIGAALHISEDAARMRTERALEKLRAALASRGITSTAAALGTIVATHPVISAPAGLAAASAAAALATPGLTAGAAFILMSTNKMVVGISLVAALGIGSAIYESRGAAQNAVTMDKLRREREVLLARTAALETQLRIIAEQRATTAVGDGPRSVIVPPAENLSPEEDKSASSASPPQGSVDKSANDRLEVEKFRAELRLRYAALYRRLGLDADQIAKFEATLVEMQQGLVDIWSSAEAVGIKTSQDAPLNTAVARMTSDPIKVAQSAVEQLLGPAGYAVYQEFNRLVRSHSFASELAGAIYGTASPLAGDQGEALAQILKTNTQQVKTRMADDGGRPLFRLSDMTDWEAAKRQAAAVLTPVQLEAFHALAEQKRLEQEQVLAEERAMGPAAGPGK